MAFEAMKLDENHRVAKRKRQDSVTALEALQHSAVIEKGRKQ